MNSCFGKPCPGGFAFHKEYPIQLDYSGSFRYILLHIIMLISPVLHRTSILSFNLLKYLTIITINEFEASYI
jgi:hypothetical protein